MDFFQHQDKAKSRTVLLVILYCLGLLGLTGIVVAVTLIYCSYMEAAPNMATMALCIGGVFVLVVGGSLFKMTELSSGGGRGVAESLGGRQVCCATNDSSESQLYNVVEEMALAAGVPMPTLYMMDNEKSINAFAAGFSPNAAAIGVTRGAVEYLTRDELQGVIAHEFSHILNGDMRMNMRLLGMLYGLQLVALVGYHVIKSTPLLGVARANAMGLIMRAGPLLVGGVTLMIIGYIGVVLSAVIRAAISRQREYLADAAAVQFTRNPDGITGALKKIGCRAVGSNVSSAFAAESSHLFFGNVCGLFSCGTFLATHPDLTTRIRRIAPDFDGRFPKLHDFKKRKHSDKTKTSHFKNLQPRTASKQSVIKNIGELNITCILTAGAMLKEIPKAISISADNPLTAQAVFFAMLLDYDEEPIRNRQLNQIQTLGSPFLREETERLYSQIRTLPEHEKIPLAQHLSATLREMTGAQYRRFSKILDSLISATDAKNLFEYTIKAVLHRDLDIHFGLAKQLRVRFTTLESVRRPVVAVLSYLAYAGHTNQQDAEKAYSAATEELKLSSPMLKLIEITTRQFDHSLRTLAETCPVLKKQVFTAFMTCVSHDGKITPKEAGLIRAIAAMLAIPIPVLA